MVLLLCAVFRFVYNQVHYFITCCKFNVGLCCRLFSFSSVSVSVSVNEENLYMKKLIMQGKMFLLTKLVT